MQYWNNIQSRFNEIINILKNNFISYLLLNLGLVWIWLVIFFLFWWLSIFIAFFVLWLNYHNLILSDLNFSVNIFLLIIFYCLFFALLFWILKATIFIWNFYLTKYIDKWEKIELSSLYILSYKKLYNRALVDLWYFIIYLWLFILIWLLIIIWSYLIHTNMALLWLFVLISIILILYLFVYISVKYYFADYYCFDKEKFDFKTFQESTNFTDKNKLEIFWNILLIMAITYVISSILWLLWNWLYNLNNMPSSYNISVILWSLFSFWFIIFVILKYVLNLLAWLFWFIYMYIYYKFLNWENNKEKITKITKEELDVKDL